MKALALLRKPDSLNRVEARYWDRLVLRGDVPWFAAHRFTLLLGPDCRFTPDFSVQRTDGTFEFHEVKGPFIRTGDDGMVKLRTAASQFPMFRWVLAQEGKDKSWTEKEIVP